jgi:hypothetical protein
MATSPTQDVFSSEDLPGYSRNQLHFTEEDINRVVTKKKSWRRIPSRIWISGRCRILARFASETTNIWACTSPDRIQVPREKKICGARGVQKPTKDVRWLFNNLAIQGKEATRKGYKKDQVHSSRSAYQRRNKPRRPTKIADHDTYSNRKRVHAICLLHGKRKRKNKSAY